ncbi:MAG: MarC family protein [Candidatus Omnitrophica bacterium]|nr:MarC family protein [Candidatus Omnitrophota bacterium]
MAEAPSIFWNCFVPLFVAVDAIGVLPIYLNLTEGIQPLRQNSIVIQSVITALLVAVLFLLGGQKTLALLGITVADFMIAGGLVLLIIAVSDLLTGTKAQRKLDVATIGAVPIGVPLITGPAVLTTCVLLMNHYGFMPTLIATVLNICIAGIIFWFSRPISRFLGSSGMRTLSKIASLLLTSIGVMMVRKGISAFIPAG